jgi:hypothetical protein
MRFVALALAFLLLAETAALACSCLRPGSPEESRGHARELMRKASAIVEVDVLAGYDARLDRGEQVRVRRVLAGRAPRSFQVNRLGAPSSAACQMELQPGERRTLILFPAKKAGSAARFNIHGLCDDHLVQEPYLRMTLKEARRRL